MRYLVLVVMLFTVARSSDAQRLEPRGRYVQIGSAFGPGAGLNVGSISARTVYTREIQLISDLLPLFRKSTEQAQVKALIGFSIRVFGVERLIGNAPYRGFDIDLGLRTGPGLAFSTRDSRVDKNRRFVFLVEPVVRISRSSMKSFAFYLELGSTSPSLRAGLWLPW